MTDDAFALAFARFSLALALLCAAPPLAVIWLVALGVRSVLLRFKGKWKE